LFLQEGWLKDQNVWFLSFIDLYGSFQFMPLPCKVFIHRRDAKTSEMNSFPFTFERKVKGNYSGCIERMVVILFPCDHLKLALMNKTVKKIFTPKG